MPSLPQPPPPDPMPLIERWLLEAAERIGNNPWAMALASVGRDHHPAVRYVLLKHLDAGGFLVFFTNYGSRKAAELDAAGTAAAALYWPDLGRQLRFEGRVARSPDDESDAYFASRPRLSQLNAWASRQSAPIESLELMRARIASHEREFEGHNPIPRPAHWGGYRLTIDAVELWVEGQDRFHERLRYERAGPDDWRYTYLQP
jgi:pyridoxamine 5'-phosphate oxidase